MKSILLQGVLASIIASVYGVIYLYGYQTALRSEFTEIINPVSITIASTVGCLLMSAGCAIVHHFRKKNLLGWLYILISVLSLISILGPISLELPVEVSNPQLFTWSDCTSSSIPRPFIFCACSFF